MNKKKNKSIYDWKSIFFAPFALVMLFVFAHRFWFDPSAILSNGDWLYFYPETFKLSQWGAWVSSMALFTPFGGVNFFLSLSLMMGLGKIFSSIGLTQQHLMIVFFYIPISIVGSPSIYFYLLRLTKNPSASLIGSLFYLFNTLILVTAMAAYPILVVFYFTPLLFLLIDILMERFTLQRTLFLLFILSIIIFFEARHALLTVIILFFYVIFRFFVLEKRKIDWIWIRKSSLMFFALLIIFLFMNFSIVVSAFFPTSINTLQAEVTSRALIKPGWIFFQNALTSYYPFWTGGQPTQFYNVPIPWYFWFIPAYVFLPIFFIKKNKLIGFFVITAIIVAFFGKGPSDPFPEVYEWLYYHFPLFNFFRDASKFWLMLLFSYSILLTLSITYFTSFILRLSMKSITKKFILILFTFPIIFIIFLTAKPAFTTELGPGYKPIQIPESFISIKNFLHEQKAYSRVLQVPAFSRIVYFSEIHPRLAFNELPNALKTLNPYILRLLAIKYIILPDDPFYDVYPGNSSREIYKHALDKYSELKLISDYDFGKNLVFENKIGSVPHIYPISNYTMIDGEMRNISDIFPLMDYENGNFLWKNQNGQLQHFPDNTVQEKISQNFLLLSCLTCKENVASNSAKFEKITMSKEENVDFFIPKNGLATLKLFIDREEITLGSDNTYFYKKGLPLKKGNHAVELEFVKENVASMKNFVQPLKGEKKEITSIRHNNLKDYTGYLLSFDYFLPQDIGVDFQVNQNTDFYFQYQQNKKGGTPWRAYEAKLESDGKKHSQFITFNTSFGLQWMELLFKIENSKMKKGDIRVENITLMDNEKPQIILRRKDTGVKNIGDLPIVAFQEINPTHYNVHVSKATEPFFLVFAEGYNNAWNAYYAETHRELSIEKSLETDMQNVHELPYANSYDILYSIGFKGQKNNLIRNHMLINAYGNMWYLDRVGSYDIEIVFVPQKEFIFGIITSLVSICVVGLLLSGLGIATIIKRYQKKIHD